MIRYSLNKLKTLFSLKNTIFLICFSLLLFLYFINVHQGKSPEKIRFNFTFYFCFIQSIIAYLITSSELLSGIRSGFDKLLFSYRFGINKILTHSIFHAIIYQVSIAIIVIILIITYDGLTYQFNTFRTLTELNTRISFLFIINLLCNIVIILFIHYSCVLRIKNFIGNMLGISLVLFFLTISVPISRLAGTHFFVLTFADLLGIISITKEPLSLIFLANRIFILSLFLLFFYLSLSYYAKNRHPIRISFNIFSKRKYYLFYSINPFFVLFRYHWRYIWQQKSFILLFLLLMMGISIDIVNVHDTQIGHHQLLMTNVIIQSFRYFEVFPLLFAVFSIFIPMNLLDALHIRKFYRINHATPINNTSIVFSIILTYFFLFILCLLLIAAAYTFTILNKFGIENFVSFNSVLVAIFYQYMIYFFAGCGFILLYLIIGNKILTILVGIILYYLLNILEFSVSKGNLSQNWYLLSYFHVPEFLVSDINHSTNTFQWYCFSLYACYWFTLSAGLLWVFSSFYPRGEKHSFKQRYISGKREISNKKWFCIPAILFSITFICAYKIIVIQNKSIQSESRQKDEINYIEKTAKTKK